MRLKGRTFVVTGATSGIGKECARALAKAGARVILAARDQGKGERVAAELSRDVSVRTVDLLDPASVQRFAAALDQPIDVLLNNAGVMGLPFTRTANGFEAHWGVNHLGAFALTGLLLPWIRDRVVTVSSLAHRHADFGVCPCEQGADGYDASRAYANSKPGNLLFGFEPDRKLKAAGSEVRSIAAHPGLARPNLPVNAERTPRLRPARWLQATLGQPASNGALPVLTAATADVPGGAYIGPGGIFGLRGQPGIVDSSPLSRNLPPAKRIWDVSEKMTGVRYLNGGK